MIKWRVPRFGVVSSLLRSDLHLLEGRNGHAPLVSSTLTACHRVLPREAGPVVLGSRFSSHVAGLCYQPSADCAEAPVIGDRDAAPHLKEHSSRGPC